MMTYEGFRVTEPHEYEAWGRLVHDDCGREVVWLSPGTSLEALMRHAREHHCPEAENEAAVIGR